MPVLTEFGDGLTTTFKLPLHNKQATATVNGSSVTIASQGDSSVTLAVAPASGATVAITYTPLVQRTGPQIIAQKAPNVSVTGTTAETTLDTITIPGGVMGPNGTLRVTTFWTMTNNANNKTFIAKLGGTTMVSNAQASAASVVLVSHIRNLGLQSIQSGHSTVGSSSGTGQTGTVDTSANQTLALNATLAVGTDTATLKWYIVEVLPAS